MSAFPLSVCMFLIPLWTATVDNRNILFQNQCTEVQPKFPLMSDLLYENPYSGQLWMIFNSKKQHKCTGDAYSRQYITKLDKDDYILRLQVRLIKKKCLYKYFLRLFVRFATQNSLS